MPFRPEFITLQDLVDAPAPPSKLKLTRDGVYLPSNHLKAPPERWAFNYFIAWERIDTPTKLLHWVRHLSEKSWPDKRMLEALIDAVDHRFGFHVRTACREVA